MFPLSYKRVKIVFLLYFYLTHKKLFFEIGIQIKSARCFDKKISPKY